MKRNSRRLSEKNSTVPHCIRCERDAMVGYGIHRFSDGSEHVIWWCFGCERYARHGAVGNINKEELEVVKDDSSQGEVCSHEMCSDTRTQLHHYFPSKIAAIFGINSDYWPVLPLCKRHHRIWHDCVTWYLMGCGKYADIIIKEEGIAKALRKIKKSQKIIKNH